MKIRPNPIPNGKNDNCGNLYNPNVDGSIKSPTINIPTKKVIDVEAPTKGKPMLWRSS